MSADAGELVGRRPAAQDREVANLAMTGDHHVVGEDDVVADAAVVRDMGVGEQDATRADDRAPAAAGGAGVHRHAFADQAIFADRQTGALAAIFEVLRLVADRREGKTRPRAPISVTPATTHMRDQLDAVAEPRLRADMAERADVDARSEPAPGSTQALGWMKVWPAKRRRQRSFVHQHRRNVASQTRTPSTIASPRYHQMLRRWAMRVMW